MKIRQDFVLITDTSFLSTALQNSLDTRYSRLLNSCARDRFSAVIGTQEPDIIIVHSGRNDNDCQQFIRQLHTGYPEALIFVLHTHPLLEKCRKLSNIGVFRAFDLSRPWREVVPGINRELKRIAADKQVIAHTLRELDAPNRLRMIMPRFSMEYA